MGDIVGQKALTVTVVTVQPLHPSDIGVHNEFMPILHAAISTNNLPMNLIAMGEFASQQFHSRQFHSIALGRQAVTTKKTAGIFYWLENFYAEDGEPSDQVRVEGRRVQPRLTASQPVAQSRSAKPLRCRNRWAEIGG